LTKHDVETKNDTKPNTGIRFRESLFFLFRKSRLKSHKKSKTKGIDKMDILEVYTNGAYLQAMEVNGKWRWVVMSFEDDSFIDGNIVDVTELANTKENLILDEDVTYRIDGKYPLTSE
jgi:hypothetical protein